MKDTIIATEHLSDQSVQAHSVTNEIMNVESTSYNK